MTLHGGSILLRFFILGSHSGKDPKFNEICDLGQHIQHSDDYFDIDFSATDFLIVLTILCFISVVSNFKVVAEIERTTLSSAVRIIFTWCEALSSVSSSWGALRAKFQGSTKSVVSVDIFEILTSFPI